MTTCPHRADIGMTGACASCEDALHLSRHPVRVDGCYACKLTSLQWSPSINPATYNSVAPRTPNNAWERGIVTSPRPGGHEMPVLDPKTLDPIPIKDLSHRRHEIEGGLRELRNAS